MNERFSVGCNLLAVGAILRTVLLFYGSWHDKNYNVKYTDVDYRVFTTASYNVLSGRSPYEESTYRYSPIICFILTPNKFTHDYWGKILFSILDILCGFIMICLTKNSYVYILICWIINPLTVAVSSRGNAESLIGISILLTFYNLKYNKIIISGIFYGIAIHLRIYPVIYSIPIYIFMKKSGNGISSLIPNIRHIKFGLSTFITLSVLTSIFYSKYGMNFINSSYLYHISRQDIKHNFSLFFYWLYIFPDGTIKTLISSFIFLIQGLLCLQISWKFRNNLIGSCLLITIIFVGFNKVFTSQYFIWHLFLLPIALDNIPIQRLKYVALSYLTWVAAQSFWLFWAYKLEFEGKSVFLQVFVGSILVFISHIYQYLQIEYVLMNKLKVF